MGIGPTLMTNMRTVLTLVSPGEKFVHPEDEKVEGVWWEGPPTLLNVSHYTFKWLSTLSQIP
jgi:hypothetical protein